MENGIYQGLLPQFPVVGSFVNMFFCAISGVERFASRKFGSVIEMYRNTDPRVSGHGGKLCQV